MDNALVLGQALGFAGLVLLVGATVVQEVFRLEVAEHRLLRGALAGGLLVAAAAAWQAVGTVYELTGGVSGEDLSGFLRDTHPGRALVGRGLLAIVVPFLVRLSRPAVRRVLVTVLALGLLWTFTSVSHAESADGFLPKVADELHLIGAVTWAGLLWYFVWLGPGLVQRGVAADVVGRLSDGALASVAVLAVTGVYAAWLRLPTWGALPGTPYGRILLWKVSVVALTVALGAFNRWQLVPNRMDSDAVLRLCRTVLVESCLLIAVLGLTGLLTRTDPPGQDGGDSLQLRHLPRLTAKGRSMTNPDS